MATKAQLAAAAKKAAKKAAGAAAPAAGAAPAAAGPNMQTLSAIVTATKSEPGFCYMDKAELAPLLALLYVEVREDITEEGTNKVATRATDAGIAAVQAASSPFAVSATAQPAAGAPAPAPAPAPAVVIPAASAPAAPATATSFVIVAGVPIPAAKRFGKASVYPFDSLNVGQAFFVPATKERENPAKSMASTVNSATARYAVEDGMEADGVTPKFKYTRKFTLRNVPDGKEAGFGVQFAGVRGAGVWRTA